MLHLHRLQADRVGEVDRVVGSLLVDDQADLAITVETGSRGLELLRSAIPGERVAGIHPVGRLAPDLQTRTVWDLASNDRSARRAVFWYPGGGNKGDLASSYFGSEVDELDVSDWSLEAGSGDRKFQLLWSDKPVQREAKSDPNAYRFEIDSALGPMLFAWYGEPLDEELGSTRFAVTIQPEGTDLEAPIEIIFEDPLPLRPEKP